MTNYFREPDDLVKKAREIMTGVKIQEKKEELDPVNKQAVKKKFADRKDKDIDNDGDVDSTDKYLHKRRKAISKEINEKDMECPSCGKMMTAGAGEKCPKCGKMINAAHCEEVELDEAKDQDSDGEKMTAAQKQDMDGDGKKDSAIEKKKKKNNDKEMEGKPDKIETEPSQDDVKTMVNEREMTSAQKAKLDKMKKKYEGGEMHKAMKAKYGDKADEVFYGKLTKMAMGEEVDMNENRTGYNKDSVDKAIKRDPRIKGKEAKAIHALLKGRSAKNRKEEVDMNENNDDEKDTNLIMQLRKVISLRGNKVKFGDGKSANVTDKDAQKFMSMFSKLKKPAEKQMLMKSASKSHMHFKNALAGKVEKPKSGGLDLPGLKSNK